ncbi:hypothetical protein [Corallococcus sp. 4LFB]|uniref:hypothetical protein n=1 Tax=Corallococcus sp. 4LFB TaxID=3383249 RepID=UPI003974B217
MNELRATVAKHKSTVEGFGSGITPRLSTAKGEVETLVQGVVEQVAALRPSISGALGGCSRR